MVYFHLFQKCQQRNWSLQRVCKGRVSLALMSPNLVGSFSNKRSTCVVAVSQGCWLYLCYKDFIKLREWNHYLEEELQLENNFRYFDFWGKNGLGWQIIFKWPLKNNFSSLRSSSISSANMKLKISGICNVGLLLILKFSSILKVILIATFFVHINLSFDLLVFLDSTLNFEHFWFLNLINPSIHSKVTVILII